MHEQELKSCFIRGDLLGAVEYMDRYDELRESAAQYRDMFENERYLTYDVPEVLNAVLLDYQKYYRDAFWLRLPEKEARAFLLERLRGTLGLPGASEEKLENALQALFEQNGYHILTGDTCGYCGPYVWKQTEPTEYEVELPGGVSRYTVNILRGFVMRSWMDYLTFGKFGTGGWAGKDGVINCIESAYDFDSERFRVSLLKHEAQHTEDMKRWPEITPAELEYRAKLVELIYTGSIALLEKFLSEADGSLPDNSHAMASAKLADGLGGCVNGTPEDLCRRARELFDRDSAARGR